MQDSKRPRRWSSRLTGTAERRLAGEREDRGPRSVSAGGWHVPFGLPEFRSKKMQVQVNDNTARYCLDCLHTHIERGGGRGRRPMGRDRVKVQNSLFSILCAFTYSLAMHILTISTNPAKGMKTSTRVHCSMRENWLFQC